MATQLSGCAMERMTRHLPLRHAIPLCRADCGLTSAHPALGQNRCQMNQVEIDAALSAIGKSFDPPHSGDAFLERAAEYHRSDYRAYLESPQWKKLRAESLRRAKYLCQICASPQKLQVHHRKYPRFLGTEPVEDLTVLCHRCHRQWHGESENG